MPPAITARVALHALHNIYRLKRPLPSDDYVVPTFQGGVKNASMRSLPVVQKVSNDSYKCDSVIADKLHRAIYQLCDCRADRKPIPACRQPHHQLHKSLYELMSRCRRLTQHDALNATQLPSSTCSLQVGNSDLCLAGDTHKQGHRLAYAERLSRCCQACHACNSGRITMLRTNQLGELLKNANCTQRGCA